jgi:hypothetical protein
MSLSRSFVRRAEVSALFPQRAQSCGHTADAATFSVPDLRPLSCPPPCIREECEHLF